MLTQKRFAALAHRDFALLWGANIVSRIGTQMRDVALVWQLYVLTRSPLALGLLGAARVGPVIVLAMGGGVAADAFDRRRLMLVTQTVLAATSAALAVLAWAGSARPSGLYALVAMAAAANAFDNPARQAFMVNLLPAEDLPGGLALGILGWQVATVVGPAVGGVLIAATSLQAIYAVDTVSFAAVLGALVLIRPRGVARAAGEGPTNPAVGSPRNRVGSLSEAGGDAIRFLRSKPTLVALMLLDFFATFFAGSLLLLPIFANEIFRVGARGLGWLASAPAVGALAASAWMSYRPPSRHQGATVLLAVAAYGASVALFGVTKSFVFALVLLAISGAADAVSTVIRQIVRQTMTPDAMRGRMTAINMMFFMSGPQLGEVEAGALAQLTSARFSVTSGGLACVVLALVVAIASPSLRRLDHARAAEA